MNAEIIAIGTEGYFADVANMQANYLSKELAALGIDLLYHSVSEDNEGQISQLFERALSRSDLVILTGGAGPMNDELTVETACKVMGVELAANKKALKRIKAYYKKAGREMPEDSAKFAMLPRDGKVFYNDNGTAPAVAIEKGDKHVLLIPGPAQELIPTFDKQLIPYLEDLADADIAPRSISAAGEESAENSANGSSNAVNSKAAAKSGKKAPWYKRLARYLIPWKGDPVREIIRKCVFLVALVTLIGSSIYITNYLVSQMESDVSHNNTVSLYQREPTVDEIDNLKDGYLEKFAALYAQNPDIRGWIRINNINVNYPVVQTTNNSYYLSYNFEKKRDGTGEPYVDYRCNIGKGDQLSTNTIIYGHNGSNHRKFYDIKEYKDINFYKKSPVVYFDTLYEEIVWKVIACFVTTGVDDGGYFFQYHNFIEAESQEHFDWYIRQVMRRSLYTTTVDVEYGDKLLTLSTCANRSELYNGRVVVVCRRLRDGESPVVDTAGAVKNPNPLYPDSWYKRHGGKKPEYPYDPDPSGNDYPPQSTATATVKPTAATSKKQTTTSTANTTTSTHSNSSAPPASSASPPVTSSPSSTAPPQSSSPQSTPPPTSSEQTAPPATSEASSNH